MEHLLRTSNLDLYRKAWGQITELFPEGLVSSYEEGMKKVLTDDYVLIWDEVGNSYAAGQNCDLVVAANAFSSREYGLGIRKGFSQLRSQLSTTLLHLDQEGFTELSFNK